MKRKKNNKGSGGPRPSRQRTQVKHFTDSNPGTFTKKKKRRRGSDEESGSSESESDDDNSQQQRQNNDSNVAQQQQQQLGNYPALGYAAAAPNFTSSSSSAAKHKRKRPSKSNAATTSSNYHAKANSSNNANRKSKNASGYATIRMQETPVPPPPQNVMLPHTGAIAPILPLATTCPLAKYSLAQQYPVVYGRGLGTSIPPEPPAWKNISQYEFYFPEDYKQVAVATPVTGEDASDPSLSNAAPMRMAPMVQQGPWPVCRVVTSVCDHQQPITKMGGNHNHTNTNSNSQYMAVGDSAGFILLHTTGPRGVRAIARLDTSASRREHARQRLVQTKVEQQCRHKPELLEKKSPFWATAKTPNAIESMTWVEHIIILMTDTEIEAIQLLSTATNEASAAGPSQTLGGHQHCQILWTMPVTPVAPRKNGGSNSLRTGGGLAGSCLGLHHGGNNMVLWNTWGVAPVAATINNAANAYASNDANGDASNIEKSNGMETDTDKGSSSNCNSSDEDDEEPPAEKSCDWPLLLMNNADTKDAQPKHFVKIIPFQRLEEVETPPAVPVKRTAGRPRKKDPKPRVPVTESELLWKESSSVKCHAALWDKRPYSKRDRIVIAYSTADTDAQVYLALLVLTDEPEAPELLESPLTTTDNDTTKIFKIAERKPQYAKLRKQIAVPVNGPRNVANVPEVTLRQSPKGTYTLVAGSRGVRMYATETMTLLRVYGENVSLHGKAMVWKSCFVLDNHLQQQLYRQQQDQLEPKKEAVFDGDGESDLDGDDVFGNTLLRQNRQGFLWIEQDNSLATLLDDEKNKASGAGQKGVATRRGSPNQKPRSSSIFELKSDMEDDETTWLHQAWIVGIPHPFRGPKELQETLYFWQGPEKLPLFTLPLPHECGGVQSIHPLVPQGNRSNSMWQKLMVATVHGECFELTPTLKSSFAGNMYNPGYSVIEDNIEYIEDEDELDKVMVEVREKKEEEEEEAIAESAVGLNVGGDFDDPALAEAIRLSLLESKDKSKAHPEKHAADGDDDDEENDSTIVVVKDSFDDYYQSEMVIPCEPEPFLRQKVLLDVEPDALVDSGQTIARDNIAKDAEFASEVMPILPQAKFAQRRWEKQKTRIEQYHGSLERKTQFLLEKPQQAAGSEDSSSSQQQPASGKLFGKGKRSRAGNLGALLEASIDPELRQYMLDRDRLWVDGCGAALQDDAWGDVDPAVGTLEQLTMAVHTPDEEVKPAATAGDDQTMTEASASTDVTLTADNGKPALTGTHGKGFQVVVIELKDFTDEEQQYSCTATIEIPLSLSDCDVPNEESPTSVSTHSVPPIAANGARGVTKCAACQGRMVIHSCGKRDLPIDFEALAKAEKEKKELADTEKKRFKIEKRKQAEAKRRDAKRKKKEQERQEKVAKEEELRVSREADIAEARARMANIGDCIGVGSPERVTHTPGRTPAVVAVRGVSQETATTVPFAITDAWKEHAQKFSSNEASASDPTDTVAAKGASGTRSDALAALAFMAEAATPQTGAHPLPSHAEAQSDAEPAYAVAESAGKSSVNKESMTGVALPVHGFYSQEDAYPHHLKSQAPFEDASVARTARANKVLNSYHDAVSGGMTNTAVAPGGAGTTPTKALAFAGQEARAHSFQISPSSHAAAKQTPAHHNFHANSTALPDVTSARKGGPIYFGYTQLSSGSKLSAFPPASASPDGQPPVAAHRQVPAGAAAPYQINGVLAAATTHGHHHSHAFPPAAAVARANWVHPQYAEHPHHPAVSQVPAASNLANGAAQHYPASQPAAPSQPNAVHKNP